MHLRAFLIALLGVGAAAASASAAATEDKPALEVEGSFGNDNPFGLVVNGASNKIHLAFQNNSPQNLTIASVHASFTEPGHGQESADELAARRIIRNTTTVRYNFPVPTKLPEPVRIPYAFHSEFKPQELGLNVWVSYRDQDKKQYSTLGYSGVVTVVEPEASFFDLQLIFLYALLLSFLGAGSYFTYNSYFRPSKRAGKRSGATSTASKPVPSRTTSDASGLPAGVKYEEEWIPEHHLRQRTGPKSSGRRTKSPASSGLSSGEEGSAGKRKGRK